jgi:hypothetical protein
VIAAVLICTMVTVAIAAIRLAPRMHGGRLIFDVAPDAPHAFGYHMSWIAIRTRDTAAVLAALDLHQGVEPANWRTGLGAVYDPVIGAGRVFVTPPVNGWTLVVGQALPSPSSRRLVDKTLPLIGRLGEHFVEVQYFASYPDLDFYAWVRVIDRRLVRAFAINDEGVVWNKGRPTKEELALGLKRFDMRGVRGRKGDTGDEIVLYPTEDHMLSLALKWSLDPTKLSPVDAAPALGVVATAPPSWRPERLAQTTRAAA